MYVCMRLGKLEKYLEKNKKKYIVSILISIYMYISKDIFKKAFNIQVLVLEAMTEKKKPYFFQPTKDLFISSITVEIIFYLSRLCYQVYLF